MRLTRSTRPIVSTLPRSDIISTRGRVPGELWRRERGGSSGRRTPRRDGRASGRRGRPLAQRRSSALDGGRCERERVSERSDAPPADRTLDVRIDGGPARARIARILRSTGVAIAGGCAAVYEATATGAAKLAGDVGD